MYMKKRYILFLICSCFALIVSAQKEERDFLRKGNRQYKDSLFVDAEVSYRKALEANPMSTDALYNIGNTLTQQEKYEEAIKEYANATKVEESRKLEKDKMKLAHIYHNMGVIYQAGQDYAKAIEAYKMSLRTNPKDDETRYNLALAQKQLQDQQDQNQDQDQDQNQDQNEDQKDDQQKQDQNQDNQDQNQDQKDQQQQDQQQNQQDQQENKENEMSRENAEQLLNSVMQDEKETQEKLQKMQMLQGTRLEKDW